MEEKLTQLNELIDGYNRLIQEEREITSRKRDMREIISRLYFVIIKNRNPDITEAELSAKWKWTFWEKVETGRTERIILEDNRLTIVMKEEKKEQKK